MSEQSGGSKPTFEFAVTPLEFFGNPVDETSFGYPAVYHEQIAEARLRAQTWAADIEQKRLEDLQVAPVEEHAAITALAEAHIAFTEPDAIRSINQGWYQRRFRSPYINGEAADNHHVAHDYFTHLTESWLPGPPPPRPHTPVIARYLNAAIVENSWSGVFRYARLWHDQLPESDPDRAVAADYVGFSGNLIVSEYCRVAKALADDRLIGDEGVRIKHLLTICWPTANELEAFIPEEAAQVKQFLREVFLQYAARGISMRREIEHYGFYLMGEEECMGSTEECDAQAERSLRTIMRFDTEGDEDRLAIEARTMALVDDLAAQQRWYAAIDFLDMARYAFDLPVDIVQERIDQLAIEGMNHLTRDMTQFQEPRHIKHGSYEYVTTNQQEATTLQMAPGISKATKNRMVSIETMRNIEFQAQTFTEESEDMGVTEAAVFNMLETLAVADAEIAQRFVSADIVDVILDTVARGDITRFSAQKCDEIVKQLIDLTHMGVLTVEQQNEAITSMFADLSDRAADNSISARSNYFELFIGLSSPILRATRPAEAGQDEILWRFVSKQQFTRGMSSMIRQLDEGGNDSSWYADYLQAFLEDTRAAWNRYWREVEYY